MPYDYHKYKDATVRAIAKYRANNPEKYKQQRWSYYHQRGGNLKARNYYQKNRDKMIAKAKDRYYRDKAKKQQQQTALE